MKGFFPISFFLLLVAPVSAGLFSEKCPCGPDFFKGPIRLLLMQGANGGDFRNSCRKHDACYERPGVSQRACDDAFRVNLLVECDKNSRNPEKCRRKATFACWLVSKFGHGAYRVAQSLAVLKPR